MENYEEPPASAESVPDPVGLDESAPSGEEMAERFRAAESAPSGEEMAERFRAAESAPSGEEMAERFRAAASQEEAFRDGYEQIRSQDPGPFEGDAAPKDEDLSEGEDGEGEKPEPKKRVIPHWVPRDPKGPPPPPKKEIVPWE